MTVAAFRPTVPTGSLLAILRPLLLLGTLAFFAGFGGYLIFGPADVMGRQATQSQPAPVAVSATPAVAAAPSSDAWNLPKQI
ncbi:hypothetical protein [Phenylobacterium sp.]|uniref:hypothetical protein n=1 Tax=Phenylobacterium sp. TaxID=1871053 RepID=UPI0011FEF228|nr:hypothetical protein [Phenylobacterium sp.]THD60396.1 MAG: hypothetical protein E8A49_13190 [Phenylobacterium sp.]